jgi:hypothetical protein
MAELQYTHPFEEGEGFWYDGGMEMPQKTIEQRLDGIENTLREHDALLRVVYEHTKKIQRFILWGRVMSLIYLILIVAPLILAAVYLPPLLQQYVGSYQELLDLNSTVKGGGMLQNLQNQLDLFNATK